MAEEFRFHLETVAANLERTGLSRAEALRRARVQFGGVAPTTEACRMAYAVSQRTRELGIRIALGAPRRRVIAMIVWEGLAVACLGILIGIAMAWAGTRTLRSLLYGISTTDLASFV